MRVAPTRHHWQGAIQVRCQGIFVELKNLAAVRTSIQKIPATLTHRFQTSLIVTFRPHTCLATLVFFLEIFTGVAFTARVAFVARWGVLQPCLQVPVQISLSLEIFVALVTTVLRFDFARIDPPCTVIGGGRRSFGSFVGI